MSKKVERAVHGPGWVEIILGIVLSLILGVVLGAALMVIRPVETVKELPKEPDAKVVYFIEGSKDSAKAKQAPAKRAAFAKGQTVSVNEDELNSLIPPPKTPPPAPPPAKKAEAPKKGEKAPVAKALPPSTPNFRIRDGEMQVAVPMSLDFIGQTVVVQGRGGFAKQGDKFVFVPNTLYLGSCPVSNIPFLSDYVRDHLLVIQPVPEDIAAAWPKLTNVSVEGNLLTLAMQ